MPFDPKLLKRRKFLMQLAASGLVAPSAAVAAAKALAQETGEDAGALSDVMAGLTTKQQGPINVFDYHDIVAREMPRAHFGYLSSGVLGDATVGANRDAYDDYAIRARRLVDVTSIDTSISVFGETWPSPIALCPVGSQRAFHPEGEIATARAARALGAKQILSTVSTISVEDVIAARAGPVWFQLYTSSNPEIGIEIMQRADNAGADAIVVTVDLTGGGMLRETNMRLAAEDERDCTACHTRSEGFSDFMRRKPMFDHVDKTQISDLDAPWMTWEYIKRLRGLTNKKLLIKGIMTKEDAEQCLQVGVDGIIISNHGGRAEESLHGTLDALPEIAKKIKKRIPMLIDGGIRRGTDVFKALALGADAICIGRPYIWGLGAAGEEGVRSVLNILNAEFKSIMAQAGVIRTSDITRNYVVRRAK